MNFGMVLVLALSISVLACGKQETAPVTEENQPGKVSLQWALAGQM